MTVATMGHQALASVNGTAMEFKSCGLKKVATILERDGIRGTRSKNALDCRVGPYTVAGSLVLEPSAADLSACMILAIGANGAVAETVSEFDVVIDRDYVITTYEDCKVNTATLRGSQGGVIELTLDLVGKTANTTGTVAAPTLAIPYIMSDVTLTMGNTAYEVMEFELVINNNLTTDRFANSLTLTDIPAGERLVTLRTIHAFNANSAGLLEPAIGGLTATNTLVLNNGTNTATFTFGVLQAPREDPDVGKNEITLIRNWIARKTGDTAEIAFS